MLPAELGEPLLSASLVLTWLPRRCQTEESRCLLEA